MKILQTANQISQAFRNAGRVREILTVFASHGFADIVYRTGLTRFLSHPVSVHSKFQDLPFPIRLKSCFEELGPTFVKLGQVLATRPDLIPEPFVEELRKLQDNVAAVSFSEIKALIETEFGKPIDSIFSQIDSQPLAAASIAQVHSATLKTGEAVAIKVQRPGIEKIIQNDISIMVGVASLLEKYVPESKPMNPVGLVDEFFRSILQELDFGIEANNMRRIKKNLAHLEKISIPTVFEKFCTSRVLTMERFEGLRFSDRELIIQKGISPSEIIDTGCQAFFHMVMKDGVFHGDLHGGNLFVLGDGKIGIIDFGVVGRLSRRVQDSIITMFLAIMDEDYETLAYEYLSLCPSTGPTQIETFQKDLMDIISPYVGMSLGEINVGRILLRSSSIAVKNHLQVPRELMLLFKAMLTIESLGKQLDPSFDILDIGHKLARQVLSTRFTKERLLRDLVVIGRDVQDLVETLPRISRRFLSHWSENQFAFEHRNKDVESVAKAIRQLSRTILFSTLSLGLFGITITLLWKNPHDAFFDSMLTVHFFLFSAILALAWGSIRQKKK
jgi:ubiquinone biosynthesis protein